MLKTKKKSKWLTALLFAVMAVAVAATAFMPTVMNVSAAAPGENASVEAEAVQPRLFTQLKVDVYGGNGEVWVQADNIFTLFPSTVVVNVYLYSSDTYTTDHTEMDLEASSYTSDLDMGTSIEARASTNGEQKYWLGRMRYKIGGADWETKTTGVALFNANGDRVA